MILFEGRKEDVYKKFQKSIDAERKMISSYMDNASSYDFLLDEPFIKETNYKYLNDILESYYSLNQYSGDDEKPLNKEVSRELLFSMRRQIDGYVSALETFEKYKSYFKYPEFRQYQPNNLYSLKNFFDEANKIKLDAFDKQNEKSAKKEVDKLFENDTLLIVKPKSYVASCYYGSGTRWCTTMKGQPSYFNQYTSNGNLYYLILKNVDRSNKFYKMAIHAPKSKKFNEDSVWYDSTDERLTSREKESVLAQMPKDAYNAMLNDFNTSFPEEKPLDVVYKIIPSVTERLEYEYKLKNGEIKLSIDSPEIVDTNTDSIIISSSWDVSVQRNGEEVHNEDGVISYTLEPGQNQVLQNYTIRMDFEVLTDSPDWDTEIIKKYSNSLTLGLDNERKSDPEYVRTQVNGAIRTILKDFQNKMEYRLRNDENLLEKYPPAKSKAYTMSKYTFTGKGRLTKSFMEYLKNIPEGKVGSKNEFLTQTGRRSGPGQYSSFFSASNMAGISARQGKAGLVKGPNFDKFYKKIFE
jgi:hypothetical protein